MTKPRIGVVGAGLMGHGIGQIFAAAGHEVVLYDAFEAALKAAPERMKAIFELLGQDAANLKNVTFEPDFDKTFANVDFVFEAAPEKPELKQEIFVHLEKVTKPGTILCTNTSAIQIGVVGARVKDKGRVVGTHYWNPPHLVPLVEVIQAEGTSLDTVEKTIALLASVGKSPVHVKKDIPGFVGNRLQHAIKREAIAMVATGVCDAETIDTVVKEGFGARLAVLGPMEQSDLVGLDLTLDIHKVLLHDLDRSDAPQQYLLDRVKAGEIGMKAGKGFRSWTPEQANAVRARLSNYLADMAKRRR